MSSKHKNHLRWLVADINFKIQHTRCPIAHEKTVVTGDRATCIRSSGVSMERSFRVCSILVSLYVKAVEV